jgi:protein SCO1/2
LTIRRNNTRLIVLAALVGLLSAAAGFSLWRLIQQGPPPATASLMVLPEPRVLADFELFDQDGRPFGLERLRGQWSLLFFGFTYCPDICPSALFDLQQVHEALSEAGRDHQVVFVSVDPERDSPERLAEYVRYFDPDFLGVTGPEAQLSALSLQIGVAYRIEPHEPGAQTYTVDHSASVLVTDPDGRLHGLFPAPHDPQSMTRDLLALND